MSSNFTKSSSPYDQEIIDITDYVLNYEIKSSLAYQTAWHCFIDTIGCGLEALEYPACTKLLGPVVDGLKIENGARVPGTSYSLDPVTAAFNIGAAIRWLDYNDTWLAAEWGHPSDNLGAILAVADWLNQNPKFATKSDFTMRDLFTAMIKAHEIQGCIALENSFNKVGIDHVVLVKVASTAVVAQMMGLSREQILAAISLAWVDGQSLRTYRHFPNAGSRKSWAAGDATSRAVRLALIARAGEMGYPTALSAKIWGFYDSSFRGNKFAFQRPYTEYVMENILFKISYPAEFHAQTAVEAAMTLNKKLIQYMVAIPLIFGRLTARDYEDDVAKDPRIDALRAKITCTEDKSFSADYHDPQKRSIANAMTITLSDGTVLDEVVVEYPVGHKRRREEGIPLLKAKYQTNLARVFEKSQQSKIEELTLNFEKLSAAKVDAVMELFTKR